MDFEELKRLGRIDAKKALDREVYDDYTEYDMIMDSLSGLSKVRIGERELQMPGLSRHKDIIMNVLAEFKGKEKKNVMPLQFAKSDDIVVAPLRPQHFGIQSYKKTVDVAATKYTAEDNIIPQTTGAFTVPDNQIFVITDFIDYTPESPIVAFQAKDVDGNTFNPVDIRKELKLSDLHIIELDFPIITDASLDIDALVERTTADTTNAETVAHELTPVGVWIGYAKETPSKQLKTEA